METDVEFPPLFRIKTVQASDYVMLFQKQDPFSEHGQSQGCGQPRKTCPNYDDVIVLVLNRRYALIRWSGQAFVSQGGSDLTQIPQTAAPDSNLGNK